LGVPLSGGEGISVLLMGPMSSELKSHYWMSFIDLNYGFIAVVLGGILKRRFIENSVHASCAERRGDSPDKGGTHDDI
jgi:hypothetical protein